MGMELWLQLNENYRFPMQSERATAVRAGATVSFGPKRAHQLHNAATQPAASVHAYSPPLRIYRSLSEYSVL